MLNVKKEICVGCKACTRACPTGAISLDAGTAGIDQDKCIGCLNCVQACPRGAIVAVEADLKPTPVYSIQELRNRFLRLQADVKRASWRLESLEQRKRMRLT